MVFLLRKTKHVIIDVITWMNSSMRFQCLILPKWLATNITYEWFLSFCKNQGNKWKLNDYIIRPVWMRIWIFNNLASEKVLLHSEHLYRFSPKYYVKKFMWINTVLYIYIYIIYVTAESENRGEKLRGGQKFSKILLRGSRWA